MAVVSPRMSSTAAEPVYLHVAQDLSGKHPVGPLTTAEPRPDPRSPLPRVPLARRTNARRMV